MVTYQKVGVVGEQWTVEEEPLAERSAGDSDLTNSLKYVELTWHVLPYTLPAPGEKRNVRVDLFSSSARGG